MGEHHYPSEDYPPYRALGRTVNLCFEELGAETVFVEPTSSTIKASNLMPAALTRREWLRLSAGALLSLGVCRAGCVAQTLWP